jgi:hypothetical protein
MYLDVDGPDNLGEMVSARLSLRLWVVIGLAILVACSMVAYPIAVGQYWMSKLRSTHGPEFRALLERVKDIPPMVAAEGVLWHADKAALSPRADWKSRPLVRSYDDTGMLCEGLIRIGKPCLPVIIASLARDFDPGAAVQSVRFAIAYTALVNIEDKMPPSWPRFGAEEPVTVAQMQALLSAHAEDDTQTSEVREAATEGLQRIGRLRASQENG